MLKFAMVRGEQMPTPTKKSQQPSKWVLMTRKDTREGPILFFMKFPQPSSPSMLTTSCRFECLGLWGFVVTNNCKMLDCSSPVKHALTSMHAHAFTLNTNPPYLLPSNVRSPKKHWNFLNYEALIDQQFLTEI